MNMSLNQVIREARKLMEQHLYRDCEKMLRQAMSDYPDDAVPHNLMGLLYEKQNDHIKAMKHFRAAWALDPTYQPALENLDHFSSFFSSKTFIFGEAEEETQKPDLEPAMKFRERLV